jgi:hypothetical protein
MAFVARLFIRPGAEVFIGRPASPLPSDLQERIARIAAGLGAVAEAHLPQCFVPVLMKVPRSVLVLIGKSGDDVEKVVDLAAKLLAAELPVGEYLDIWPLAATDRLVGPVRRAGCRIYWRRVQ